MFSLKTVLIFYYSVCLFHYVSTFQGTMRYDEFLRCLRISSFISLDLWISLKTRPFGWLISAKKEMNSALMALPTSSEDEVGSSGYLNKFQEYCSLIEDLLDEWEDEWERFLSSWSLLLLLSQPSQLSYLSWCIYILAPMPSCSCVSSSIGFLFLIFLLRWHTIEVNFVIFICWLTI